MSYAISRSSISDAAAATIRSMLSLTAETQYNKFRREDEAEPVIFYIYGNIIHLPYMFSASLFQIIPNVNICYPLSGLEFNGKLRDNQIAVETEAWEQLERYGTSTLGLYPGFGKTVLGAKLSARAGLMTVILVHREILTTQWKTTYQNVTNGRVWIVGEKNPPQICDVIICMDTRWNMISKEVRDAVGFLIIDEAHAFCTRTHVDCLLSFHPKYILIESATLLREDGMHSMIYAIAGNHGVFRESDKPFNVVKIMTNMKPVRKMTITGNVDYGNLLKSTLLDERRNGIILELVKQNVSRKILILTSLVDHVTLMYNNLIEAKISVDYLCGKKKTYQDSTVLVGTLSKIGTGMDPATSCPTYSGQPFDLLILVTSIKKTAMLVQNVGRCFRANFPTVFHLVDNDTIFTGHWAKAKKWYIMHAGIVTEHNIENKEENTNSTNSITTLQNEWIHKKIVQTKLKINKIK